jgi:hypothetical protein
MPRTRNIEQDKKLIEYMRQFISSRISDSLSDETKELLIRVFKYHKNTNEISKYLEKLKYIKQ